MNLGSSLRAACAARVPAAPARQNSSNRRNYAHHELPPYQGLARDYGCALRHPAVDRQQERSCSAPSSGAGPRATGEASTSAPSHSFRRCCSRRARRLAVSCRSAIASSSWLPRAIGAPGDTISGSVVPPTSRADLTTAPLGPGRARPAWPLRADPCVDLAVVRPTIRREEQASDDR